MSDKKKYYETDEFRLELDAFAELLLPEIRRFMRAKKARGFMKSGKQNNPKSMNP